MPLCGTMLDIKLPLGFTKVTGSVSMTREDEGPFPHLFSISDLGLILCLTPGQFVDVDDDETWPGQRIKKLVAKSPELIKLDEGTGVAMLLGDPDEIKDRLDLRYRKSLLFY